MNLKIAFSINDGEKGEKKVSKTFSKLDDNLADENLVTFAKAYRSLCDGDGFKAVKITEEDVAIGQN